MKSATPDIFRRARHYSDAQRMASKLKVCFDLQKVVTQIPCQRRNIIIIIIIIIIICNWVVTRWQWLFYMYTKHEIVY